MKFGTQLHFAARIRPRQVEWGGDAAEVIRAVAQKADDLGFAWVPVAEHIAVPRDALSRMGDTYYDPATTLAFVAGFTRRLRLLTHLVVLPYHSPLHVAKQYATLDRLSGGRLILGVGVGHLEEEFEALGANFEQRGPITDECIAAIRAVWTNEEASFAGRYHAFKDVHVSPRPIQQPHPPIWVGGNTRRAARRAVELGDGWMPFTAGPQRAAELMRVGAPFSVTPQEVADRLRYIGPLAASRERTTPIDVVIPAGPVVISGRPIDGERPRWSGSPEQIVEDIRAYEEVGVTGMTVSFRHDSLDEHLESMEHFAAEVVPRVGQSMGAESRPA